ncbi:MAG: response regulator [Planctomycetota bacterium]|nr:response regulator [Planctomycetota bacterium]
MLVADLPSILLVEDDFAWRTLVSYRLSEGFQVYACEDGEEALDVLAGARVGVILVDVVMPNMDGTALARALLRHPALKFDPPPPVLVLTGLAPEDRQVEALRRMPLVTAVFHKPIDMEVLHAAVQRAAAHDWAAVQGLAARCA